LIILAELLQKMQVVDPDFFGGSNPQGRKTRSKRQRRVWRQSVTGKETRNGKISSNAEKVDLVGKGEDAIVKITSIQTKTE